MNMICKAHRQRHIVPGIVHGITQAKDVDKDNGSRITEKKARVYT